MSVWKSGSNVSVRFTCCCGCTWTNKNHDDNEGALRQGKIMNFILDCHWRLLTKTILDEFQQKLWFLYGLDLVDIPFQSKINNDGTILSPRFSYLPSSYSSRIQDMLRFLFIFHIQKLKKIHTMIGVDKTPNWFFQVIVCSSRHALRSATPTSNWVRFDEI